MGRFYAPKHDKLYRGTYGRRKNYFGRDPYFAKRGYKGEDIDIDINVVVEYGTRINSVAESVANTVRFHVEKALGLRVNSVNVHVAGLRISDTD